MVDKKYLKAVSDMYQELKGWHKVKAYILELTSYPTVKKLHAQDLLNFIEENVRDSGVIDDGFRR